MVQMQLNSNVDFAAQLLFGFVSAPLISASHAIELLIVQKQSHA